MQKTYLTLLVCAVMIALTSCNVEGTGKRKAPDQESTLVFCDNSFENIMEQEIDVYEFIYPNEHILCRYGTETEAIDSLKDLSYRTIVIPRELTEQEVKFIKSKNRTPRSIRIAVDAVALIVNPANPINDLSKKEIAEILSGTTDNWRQVSPYCPDKPIAVLFDKSGSSMVKYMRDSLINGQQLGKTAYEQGSIKAVIDAVKDNTNAIGVIGVSWLTSDLRSHTAIDSIAADVQDETSVTHMDEINDRLKDSGVKVLGVRRTDNPTAYRPFQENIYTGDYPLTRSIYMITVSPSGSTGGRFFSFVSGNTGQKLMMKTGIMPARKQINVVELVQ